MIAEALELVRRRIELSVRESARAYSIVVGKERTRQGAQGIHSSDFALIFRDWGRAELQRRATIALEAFVRIAELADEEPSPELESEGAKLIAWAVNELSQDVDPPMLAAEAQGRGPRQVTLTDARHQVVENATLELSIILFGSRRRRTPVHTLLRAPRYEHVYEQLLKAERLSREPDSDVPNALKELTAAIESLARIVTPGSPATLGDAVKTLRNKRLLAPGVDKMIEGVSAYLNSLPTVRHGHTAGGRASPDDWALSHPLAVSALLALLQTDSSAPG